MGIEAILYQHAAEVSWRYYFDVYFAGIGHGDLIVRRPIARTLDFTYQKLSQLVLGACDL